MNNMIKYMALIAAATFLAGCAAKTTPTRYISVTPQACNITPENGRNAELDVVFHVPGDYLKKRSRLVINPQIVVDDVVYAEFMPIVVDAPIYKKKLQRRVVLENYCDTLANGVRDVENTSVSFELPYRESIFLPNGVDTARVVAVVSTDGCGECSGFDTIEVASVTRPLLFIKWIEPKFEVRKKVVNGKGEARLAFDINKFDINLELGNNRSELELMLKKLTPVLKDSLATLNSFTISGMASADGSLIFNTQLAHNRANAAKQWLASQLDIKKEQEQMMMIDSRPEGWEPVLASMVADGNPDSIKVKDILNRFAGKNDDIQEQHIRRLDCWNSICEKYLSKDRKVEYVFSYTIKSFTDDKELLEMYGKRPDAFNESELMKVSTLVNTIDQKIEVYRTILKFFPNSETAMNNLAVLYLRSGDVEKAREMVMLLKDRYPNPVGKLLKEEAM